MVIMGEGTGVKEVEKVEEAMEEGTEVKEMGAVKEEVEEETEAEELGEAEEAKREEVRAVVPERFLAGKEVTMGEMVMKEAGSLGAVGKERAMVEETMAETLAEEGAEAKREDQMVEGAAQLLEEKEVEKEETEN